MDDDAIWLQYLMFCEKKSDDHTIVFHHLVVDGAPSMETVDVHVQYRYVFKYRWMNAHLHVPCKNALIKGD